VQDHLDGFREPVTVNAILSRAQSCTEGHFRLREEILRTFRLAENPQLALLDYI